MSTEFGPWEAVDAQGNTFRVGATTDAQGWPQLKFLPEEAVSLDRRILWGQPRTGKTHIALVTDDTPGPDWEQLGGGTLASMSMLAEGYQLGHEHGQARGTLP